MSLAIDKVQTYQVYDPVILINHTKNMMVLRGGSQIQYKNITATSSSPSVVQFTAISPSLNTIIDRKILMRMPIKLFFTGTPPTASPNELLLQSENDAFRAHPIMSVMTNMSCQINTTDVTIQMADVIHPLSRYGKNNKRNARDYSMFPSMLDQYQTYFQGRSTNNNPLGSISKNSYGQTPRGAFPMQIRNHADTGDQTTTQALVKADIFEYIYLSPFSFGQNEEPGMIGVQTLDFVMNFSSLQRMWSHAVILPAQAGKTLVFDFQSKFDNPTLLFRYITPPLDMIIPLVNQLPFFKVQRYKTIAAISSTAGNQTLRDVFKVTTNNIQLTEVPRRMYIYVRKEIATGSFLETDTYFNIQNLNINYANLTGRISAADEVQLYRIALRNGFDGTWADWHGLDVNFFEGAVAQNLKPGFGSVACIEFGTDIALQPGFAASVSSNQNLQMDVSFRNITGSDFVGNVEVVILTISEGIFTIRNNTAIPQTAVLSPEDVIASVNSPMKDYNEIRHAYGTSFWDGVKHFFGQVWKTGKEAIRHVPQIIRTAAPIISTIAKAAPMVLPLLGLNQYGRAYGMGAHQYRMGPYGGVTVGGVDVGGRHRYGRKYKKRKYKRKGGRRKRYKKRGGAKLSNAQLKKLLMRM